MKRILLILIVASWTATSYGGPRVGLGSAVARQSGKVVQEEHANATALPLCTETPYSISPIDPTIPFNMEPLGHLSGASHLFPTDHVYFIIPKSTDSTITTNVYAPGNIRIIRVSQSEYLKATPVFSDYGLNFSPCQGLSGGFGHVAELSPAIAAAIGTVDQNCFVYPDGTTRYCSKEVSVDVAEGDLVGTIQGRLGSSIYSLDLGAFDYRKPPLPLLDTIRRPGDYLYTRCPLDEYEEPLRSTLLSRMGTFNGSQRRTVEPVCGTILQDVAGTAQGLWYVSGTPLAPVQHENEQLALVHDNVTPSTGAFSIGTSLTATTGIAAQQYYFTPTTSGFVNVDFNLVTPNNIYCYESFSNQMIEIILIQMPTSTTLKIEDQSGAACGTGPWAFTSKAVLFER